MDDHIQWLNLKLKQLDINLEEIPYRLCLKLKSKCYQYRNFQGIDAKLFEAKGNINKLNSIASELIFACEFSNKGFSVELISQADPQFSVRRKTLPSPDLIVSTDKLKIFVEVAKLTTSDPNFELGQHIENEIKKYPVTFRVQFNNKISKPSIDHASKSAFKDKILNLANEIKKLLPDYKNLPDSISIEGNEVYFKLLENNEQGFMGGGSTYSISPKYELSTQLLKIIDHKNKVWSGDLDPKAYIVAMDLEEFETSAFNMLHLLYGPIEHFEPREFPDSGPQCLEKLKQFIESEKFKSIDQQYHQLLYKVGYNPNSNRIIAEPGIFISDSDKYSKISGIVTRSSYDSFQYFPNPCSTKSQPELIDRFGYSILPEHFMKNK